MNKTRIDWCDSTWNPISGCRHGCEYYYARNIANRFSYTKDWNAYPENLELEEPVIDGLTGRAQAYPHGFAPTFHRYRLNEYQNKKGRNIFVCSMADLFGKWVPDDWKIEVLETCKKAPQHNYLFLTKDPIGYSLWPTKKHPDARKRELYTENLWLGVTYTGRERLDGHYDGRDVENSMSIWTNFWYLYRMSDNILPTKAHKFISIDPIACDICEVEDEREGGRLLEHFLQPRGYKSFFEWIIVGAETGRRKDKVVPKKERINKLVDLCKRAEIPIFMKSSLSDIWGEPLIQEFPEGLRKHG